MGSEALDEKGKNHTPSIFGGAGLITFVLFVAIPFVSALSLDDGGYMSDVIPWVFFNCVAIPGFAISVILGIVGVLKREKPTWPFISAIALNIAVMTLSFLIQTGLIDRICLNCPSSVICKAICKLLGANG